MEQTRFLVDCLFLEVGLHFWLFLDVSSEFLFSKTSSDSGHNISVRRLWNKYHFLDFLSAEDGFSAESGNVVGLADALDECVQA
jgi:hypothetical protein